MIESSTEFYQDLAPIYDDMTRFRERYDVEGEILQNWSTIQPVAFFGTGRRFWPILPGVMLNRRP